MRDAALLEDAQRKMSIKRPTRRTSAGIRRSDAARAHARIRARSRAWKVAVVYGLVAALWIFASGRALEFLIHDAHVLARLETVKGLFFVAMTAAMLRLLLRPMFEKDEVGWIAEAIAETEKTFSETMIESQPGIVYFYDQKGRFLRWNRNFESASGYSAEEIAAMHPLDFIAPEDQRRVEERVAEVFLQGESAVEASLLTRDGRSIPYYFTGRRVELEGSTCLVGVGLDVTERRRAEAMEHQLAAIVRSSSDAIISKTPDGIITSWNPAAAALFGYGEDEILGRSITAVVPPERLDEERAILARIAAGGSVEQLDTVRLRKDGERIDLSVTISPLVGADGTVSGASTIARDITLLKARAREIERISRLYAALSHVSQSIVQSASREELFEKVCRVLVEQGGFQLVWIGWDDPASHQIVPAAIWGEERDFIRNLAVYSTDDRPEGRGMSGVAFRENRPEVSNMLLENDAVLPWRAELERSGFRSAAVFPIQFQGAVAGILSVFSEEPGFFRDKEVALLSEAARELSFALDNLAREIARREAEESVRTERDFSEAVLNSLPGMLYLYDLHGRFLRWNPNLARVTGYTDAELATMQPLDFIVESDRERVAAAIEETFASGSSSVEANVVMKDGRVAPFYLTGVAARVGDETCLVGVGIDVTSQKEAERAMQELNETLESRVEQRTAELQAALVRAEAADRLKSAFLATMSHELRTPLNSIIGFTGILQQGLAGPLNDEQTRQLGMVRGSARHLLDVINDVLDLSKIEAGQLEIRAETFDLRESVRRVVSSMETLAAKKNLTVRMDIAPEVNAMTSDRRRIEQILLNLLSNAIKFTDHGHVSLRVDLVSGALEEKAQVRFRISDTGIGIRAQDLDVLFRPFQQVETGLTRTHEGTGLGLAISRRIAILLGGEITVRSEWTKGSEFSLTLPLERVS